MSALAVLVIIFVALALVASLGLVLFAGGFILLYIAAFISTLKHLGD